MYVIRFVRFWEVLPSDAMMSAIVYTVLYCGLFVVPGALLLFILGNRRPVSLLAVALSYAVLVLLLNVAQQCGLTVNAFNAILASLLAGLAIVALAKMALRFRSRGKEIILIWSWRRLRPGAVLPLAVLCGAVLLHALLVGPYMELPADVWSHLARFQDAARVLASGSFSSDAHGLAAWVYQGPHWYLFHAWLCAAAKMRIEDSAYVLNAMTMLFYCVAQYVLALTVFTRMRMQANAKRWMSALAAGISFWSMGYFAFSYARYYAMAPALMNFVSMAGVLCVAIRWMDLRPVGRNVLYVLPVIFLQLVLVHQTEVMYLIFSVCALALASLALGCRAIRRRALCVLLVFAFIFAAAFAVSLAAWPRDHSYSSILRALPGLGACGKNWYVLDPGLAFGAVAGPFGAMIYILAIVFLRQYLRHPYILGGLLLPWLGVFNPFVIEMALRHPPGMSPVILVVLYRINYMIPFHMAAAFLVVWAWQSAGQWHGVRALSRCACISLCVVLPLLPWGLIYSDAWWDRWQSISRPPLAASKAMWNDVLAFLQSQPESLVLTDPVTGYIINGLTQHRAMTARFHHSTLAGIGRVGSQSAIEKVYELVSAPAVMQELPCLMIVNQRDGRVGEAGRVSRHWPEDILSVSSFYNRADVRASVASLAPTLRSIWSADRVSVFSIDRKVLGEMLPRMPCLISAKPEWYRNRTLGPGITLDWTSTRQDAFIAYHVQCRANGGEWFDVSANRSGLYSWIHHVDDPFLLSSRGCRGLRRSVQYDYRVRALYSDKTSEWSNVISATIPESF